MSELTPEDRDEYLSKVEYLDEGDEGSCVIEVPIPQRIEPHYYSKDCTIPHNGWEWVQKYWPNSTPEQQAMVLSATQDKRTREVMERNQPKYPIDVLLLALFHQNPESVGWSSRDMGSAIGFSHTAVLKCDTYKNALKLRELQQQEAVDSHEEGDGELEGRRAEGKPKRSKPNSKPLPNLPKRGTKRK
jgi:hypothetical protein